MLLRLESLAGGLPALLPAPLLFARFKKFCTLFLPGAPALQPAAFRRGVCAGVWAGGVGHGVRGEVDRGRDGLMVEQTHRSIERNRPLEASPAT
jgi:hypothetical protein